MNFNWSAMMVVTTMLTLLVNVANAAMISFSDTWDFGSSVLETTQDTASTTTVDRLNFSRFDPSLGELTDVELSFTSNWTYTTEVSARSRPFVLGRVSANSTQSLLFQLLNPNGTIGESITTSSTVSCSIVQGCPQSVQETGVFNNTLDLGGIDLSNWINPVGDTVDVLLQETRNMQMTLCPSNLCDMSSFDNNWSGIATLSYIYDDFKPVTNVNEPGVLALLILGLLGFGMTRRKSFVLESFKRDSI